MIDEPCSECGFNYSTVKPSDLRELLDHLGGQIGEELRSHGVDELRRRPLPDVWSPLEYSCHVRDVLFVQRDRLYRALVEETPEMPRMHRDERVRLARYNTQDSVQVAEQLGVAAALTGQAFGDVEPSAWTRTLTYNWPAPHRLDVTGLAAHTAHEVIHHLEDMRKPLAGSAA